MLASVAFRWTGCEGSLGGGLLRLRARRAGASPATVVPSGLTGRQGRDRRGALQGAAGNRVSGTRRIRADREPCLGAWGEDRASGRTKVTHRGLAGWGAVVICRGRAARSAAAA